MNRHQELLSKLPSVDEVLKSEQGLHLLKTYPRRYVLAAVREGIDLRRREIMEGTASETAIESIAHEISVKAQRMSSLSLKRVINATGIVIHTNLGRSILSNKVMENVAKVATGYSNLEYDLVAGKRGKRHSHIGKLLREVTGAEDGFAVNNNAAAVLLCLSALAKGREVIVSRGELVEIGGSFRVPDVMAYSGAVMKEVGTTNKTHTRDYVDALGDLTALILKVHQSNYKITGFTQDVSINELAAIGRRQGIPVMYDLGSGCLVNLRTAGIHSEPTVQEIIRSGADLVTFSGDKLLGGPQAGLIVGKKELIGTIQKHPLARAVRIDKLSLAALEATLMEYVDIEQAGGSVPTLRMLLQDRDKIRARGRKISLMIKREIKGISSDVVETSSQAGGGALPAVDFPTYAVSIRPQEMTVNQLEEKLRGAKPPIIARIEEDSIMFDARTIRDEDIAALVNGLKAALSPLASG